MNIDAQIERVKSLLSDLSTEYRNMPDKWGEGAIFAYSGMDGPTDSQSGFVATFVESKFDLLIHTSEKRYFRIKPKNEGVVRIATGDVVSVETQKGDLLYTYSEWHTLVGMYPNDVKLSLESAEGKLFPIVNGLTTSIDESSQETLVLMERDGKFSLSYGSTLQEAMNRSQVGIEEDVRSIVKQRLYPFKTIPEMSSNEKSRLLKKCFSVMKVNTLSAEGSIERRWSTPDRLPHKHMWLWDSVFHSFGMNLFDAELSWEFLEAMLVTQNEDGLIPLSYTVKGDKRAETQPPLLAWGVWENYLVRRIKSSLRDAFPILERYLEWNSTNRDKNGNVLLEWEIDKRKNSRSPESGMDNSLRFNEGVALDAVDYSTFQAQDMYHLSLIADELELFDRASYWRDRSNQMTLAIHSLLWNEEDGLYFDRTLEGKLSEVRAVSGFIPLLLENIPASHIQSLIHTMQDEKQFYTAFPLPSIAVSHPHWSTDMWQGATWVNYNYMIIRGLEKHGELEIAEMLKKKTIDFVLKYYEIYGVTFEFYDAKDSRHPVDCDRKGPNVKPYNMNKKMDSIRDYHWTASLTACLLLDERISR